MSPVTHIHSLYIHDDIYAYVYKLFVKHVQLFRALFGKYVEDPSFAMYGIMAVSALLLRKGADIHAVAQSGRSPYQILPFLGTLMTILADYDDIM